MRYIYDRSVILWKNKLVTKNCLADYTNIFKGWNILELDEIDIDNLWDFSKEILILNDMIIYFNVHKELIENDEYMVWKINDLYCALYLELPSKECLESIVKEDSLENIDFYIKAIGKKQVKGNSLWLVSLNMIRNINYNHGIGEEYNLLINNLERNFENYFKYLLSEIIATWNVYEIKSFFQLEYILPSSYSNDNVEKFSNVAVFIHLYYADLLEECWNYIYPIVQICDVYITTSCIEIKNSLDLKIYKNKLDKCFVRYVENRGRDIAAFLVYDCAIMENYEYFCFLHDKKSMHIQNLESSKAWFYDLWENTIKSQNYVQNVIRCFEKNELLGLLAVPEPFWGSFSNIVENAWCGSFNDTLDLAKQLRLKALLNEKFPPITIGTAFWAKKDALKNLLKSNFTISDFPLEGVGKLSYAVERILAYVAQDRGYLTGIVMNERYATLRSIAFQRLYSNCISILEKRENLLLPSQIFMLGEKIKELELFTQKYKDIYIYGAGKYFKYLIKEFPFITQYTKSIVVSDGRKNRDIEENLKIIELSQIKSNPKNCGFILALNSSNKKEVIKNLSRVGYKHFLDIT